MKKPSSSALLLAISCFLLVASSGSGSGESPPAPAPLPAAPSSPAGSTSPTSPASFASPTTPTPTPTSAPARAKPGVASLGREPVAADRNRRQESQPPAAGSTQAPASSAPPLKLEASRQDKPPTTNSATDAAKPPAEQQDDQAGKPQEVGEAAPAPEARPQQKLSGHLRFEFQRYDGWYNNLANSDWGTPNSRLRRKVASAYSDGVYQMADEGRPSARVLSQSMMRGEDGQASARNLTTMFAFFGQVIASEILMASESGCPIEMHRIEIAKCDPMYDRDCRGGRSMPFYRAAYDGATGQSPNLPREQVNRVTSWIDGSFIYSTSETWLNTMRSFDGRGTLKMVESPEALATLLEGASRAPSSPSEPHKRPAMSLFGYPMRNRQRAPLINQMPAHHLKMKTAERMFLLGDPRTNQNPMILAFGILFYRWHNVLAERIHAQHPDWSDEEIFQRARRLVIASLQNIILYEYLPVLLDTPSPYERPLEAPANSSASAASSIWSGRSHEPPEDLIAPYSGYKPDLHPGISHVFQAAAFRFGHTMIPPGLYLRDESCNFLQTPGGFKGVRLCSTWWNAEELISRVGIEQLLMGAASQLAEREDYVLCNDVRDKLFGPLDFSRRDLAALNIMRGRDNGLADYNTVRQAFRLAKLRDWAQINAELYERQPAMFAQLASLYQNQLDRLDLYVGGMLESDLRRGRPGELFRRIIKEQFERLRDSDRFWFENLESGIFSAAEIEEIKRIRLYDIIVNSTLIPDDAIQRQVFQFVQRQDPCPQPGQLSSAQLEPCYALKGHNYFKGSELTYVLVCATLVLIPVLCAAFAALLVSYQDRKRRQFKAKQEYQRNLSTLKGGAPEEANSEAHQPTQADKFYAKEWLHSNLRRKIKVRFGPAPDQTLYILDRQGQVQRRLALKHEPAIVVELSGGPAAPAHAPPRPLEAAGGEEAGAAGLLEALDTPVAHRPMCLVRVAREHDLVLQFCSVQQRRKFVFKLQAFLRSINKSMSLFWVQREEMLANAETKERRQQRLEQFFREAYALSFGMAGNGATGNGHASPAPGSSSPDIGLVMRTSLSRQEFAEALGMRADSLFVRQMFNCVDKDGNGRISFQEFLDTVVMFSRGSPDDKLRIVFDMCDHDGRGVIEKSELVRVLRSLVDMAKTKALTEDQVMALIHEMFRAVGLEHKPLLTYDDFKLIISSHNGAPPLAEQRAPAKGPAPFAEQAHPQQILAIGLDMKGAKKNFFVDTSATCLYRNLLLEQEAGARRDKKAGLAGDGPPTPAPARQRKMTLVDSRQAVAAALEFHRKQQQQAGAAPHKRPLLKRLAWTVNDSWRAFITELEEHRQDIVYLVLFYVTVAVLFFERFINYSFLSEHMDLRHVMGVGIAITRGSAASLSFCYAMLLLSMCRNLMTWIRTMSIREYIPLDSHVRFHKIVAITALLMTVLHTVGHCVNFYHVTQQPVEHLRCLTKEMQFSGESRPTFFYWIFQTVTGSTGLLLWLACSVIYVFAHPIVRQRAYAYFWSAHKLYYLIYALTLLHGSSKLTGSPRFWIFFIIPAILFTIDKIMSLQTKLLELEIFETECLPSDVISLKFARPPSFKFLSGQWVRIACTAFRPHEFHAFTLTSAPKDDYLSVHVRAQGPWTWKLRSLFDPANLQYNKLLPAAATASAAGDSLAAPEAGALQKQLPAPPRLRIEGPFGGGNQDWYKYEVAVMIGGGIGVTPYASILNDLVFGTSTNRYSGVAYKKVYFIWICPSHRNFEWFIDVLRDVESKDVTNLLEMHIFITQFFHKFDLRTTMLYICENHFQRISNRSLFTGLKAVNHFGRPDIAALLQHVQNQHSRVSKVGVFSCGPKAMTKSITEACEKVNKRRKMPYFLHQYENFS